MATLGTGITEVLDRTGLSTSDTDYQDKARRYISNTLLEIAPEVPWWWLRTETTFKTTRTLTVSGVTGTYTVGEEVTDGQSTPYRTTVDHWDATNSLLYVYDDGSNATETTVTPTGTLTGGSSAATSTYVSREYTRVYTPISGPVTEWFTFTNETDNEPIDIVGSERYDALDWDRDDEGSVRAALVGGMDDDTGYPQIELWRTPGTTNQTIRVTYEADIAEWTSSNDDSTFLALGVPRIIERCIIYGAVSLYLEESGDDTGSEREAGNFVRTLRRCKRQNRRMQGNRAAPPIRDTDTLVINFGTSLAVAS